MTYEPIASFRGASSAIVFRNVSKAGPSKTLETRIFLCEIRTKQRPAIVPHGASDGVSLNRKEIQMIRTIALSAAVLLVAAGTASAGEGWQRSGTVTGPNGYTAVIEGGGSCSGGSCSYGSSVTGPKGKKLIRKGSVTRVAPGQFESNTTYTGPRGRTATRSGNLTVGN
jgi:hypothetical protein